MKKSIITLFFILGFINISFTQQYQVPYQRIESIDFFKNNKFVEGDYRKVLTEKDIKGSPYLNDEFVNGVIFTVQKTKYENIPLRYNIYNDNLEFKTPTGELQALDTPEIVEKAEFGDYQLIYAPYTLANKIKKGFFVVLEEGKASLYAKPGVFFKEPVEAGAYKEPEPAKFVKRADEYFIRIGNEQAILINSKKDLIAAFPENQKKIESFIDTNKTKTNKPESLKEVVLYYNSL